IRSKSGSAARRTAASSTTGEFRTAWRQTWCLKPMALKGASSMLRLPRKWVMVAGLLAAAPSVALAGPLDFLKSESRITVSAQSERSNQQMAEEIAAALKKAQFRGFDISIEFK